MNVTNVKKITQNKSTMFLKYDIQLHFLILKHQIHKNNFLMYKIYTYSKRNANFFNNVQLYILRNLKML